MKYQLLFEVKALPASLNKKLRTNRHALNRECHQWDMVIKGLVGSKKPPQPLQKARIRLVRHAHRTLDFDGLVGSLKPVVDALVSCGILKDDSWAVLGKWDVNQVFKPKQDGPLLEIEIIGE